MTPRELTDAERAAFCPDLTRDRALDYFFRFDNVPLGYVYGDRLDPGEPTDLERRNRAITETVWLESYHESLECNAIFSFTYRGSVLQMPLQVHRLGAAGFDPSAAGEPRSFRSFDELRADLDRWLAADGAVLAARLRERPAQASWQTLLARPDRTARIASIMPVRNQVVLELVTTWTEDGALRESAWVVVLVYDADGTVLQDRSYIDMANWPSGRRYIEALADAPPEMPDTIGVLDGFYDYQRSLQSGTSDSPAERQRLQRIESDWLAALNGEERPGLYHPERYRLQLPLQKRSTGLAVATELRGILRATAPEARYRLAMTYARGNQVVAEGIVSWSHEGAEREAPFIAFLLLDADGAIVRERRYVTLDHHPAASGLARRLDL